MTISRKKKRQILKVKLPKPRKEEAEFGPGKPEFVLCPVCKAVYWKKSWHHDFPRKIGEDALIQFTPCPACRMIADRMFEGQVILEGVPQKRTDEVLARIRHAGELAYARDVLARIIKIARRGSRVEVLTTENQLAHAIGRQIQEILGGKLRMRISQDESVLRAYWQPK